MESTEQKIDLAHPKNNQSSPERAREDMLAARLMAGERAAAAELVDRYYQQIYLFMRGLGHDHQVSEDLTQETFFRAWHHIGQLKDGKALNAWLYRIAGNVSRLYWRRHKDKETVSIEKIVLPDDSKAQHNKVEHFEQLTQLKDAIRRLPWKLRQTIVLHYMQHLSIAEAAEAAGVREGTFKSRLNRALKILRKQVT